MLSRRAETVVVEMHLDIRLPQEDEKPKDDIISKRSFYTTWSKGFKRSIFKEQYFAPFPPDFIWWRHSMATTTLSIIYLP